MFELGISIHDAAMFEEERLFVLGRSLKSSAGI